MDHFCLIPRSLVQASLVAVALSAGAAHAEDISLTPPAGGGFVIKDKASSAERFRVQDNGDAFVPGLANTPNTGTAMLCFDSGTGRLIQCAPGTGTGTGAQGPARPGQRALLARLVLQALRDPRALQVPLGLLALPAQRAHKAQPDQ